MKPTLLILAAGMASRYGSMKQTEGFGPSGETIMDYSIYDAIRAGFGKVVFIIRKDFADSFEPVFNRKLGDKIEVRYVYQDLTDYVDPANIPPDRTKPWGTGHAVLCAEEAIQEPFAVINADDFYGREAFDKAIDFLNTQCNEQTQAIISYKLGNTLSEHGTVSRGVCSIDGSGNLVDIQERTKIYRKEDKIVYEESDQLNEVPGDSSVSMNFWCFHHSIFAFIKDLFKDFPAQNKDNIKAEFFIPIIAHEFIKQGRGVIKVIPTSAQWFGVTYKEDAPMVKRSLDKLLKEGIYPDSLWEAQKVV
jgi:UTP-glucose-1-phosphate uridylyltransferase